MPKQPKPRSDSAAPGVSARRRRRPPIAFDLLPELIGYNLRRAQVAVFADFAATLAPCDLTPGQFGVLVLINANPGLNQTRLGEALGIDRSTVVAVIDKLEDRGLVERAPSPDDRRSYALRLSDAGLKLLDQARPLVRAHEARLAQHLDAGDQEQLITVLQKLTKQN